MRIWTPKLYKVAEWMKRHIKVRQHYFFTTCLLVFSKLHSRSHEHPVVRYYCAYNGTVYKYTAGSQFEPSSKSGNIV